jgi:hypothetical protein
MEEKMFSVVGAVVISGVVTVPNNNREKTD